MESKFNRVTFYGLSGAISGLLGWSLSQLCLDVAQPLMRASGIPPYAVLLIGVTPCVAAAMVIAEIFLSSPTRHKANWRILSRRSLKAVLILGLVAGVILSGLNWLLLASNWSSTFVRIISWALIGLFAGLAESISWGTRSIEGTESRIKQRMIQSTMLGSGAGLVASLLFESIRRALGQYAEPSGFLLLGVTLGLALCFAARPSYQAALRAGQGFEAVEPPKTRIQRSASTGADSTDTEPTSTQVSTRRPTLNNQTLKFIPDDDGFRYIEEGLSIQLPFSIKKPLLIGSSKEADICIPHLPDDCAELRIQDGDVQIKCLCDGKVQVQRKLITQARKVTLKHNQIVTLYHENNPDKFYRFVFYNRFLDPQA